MAGLSGCSRAGREMNSSAILKMPDGEAEVLAMAAILHHKQFPFLHLNGWSVVDGNFF
jgi:hypothetical protein